MMLSTHLHKMLKAHSFYLHDQCLDSVVFIVVFQPSTMRVCVILNVSLSLLLCTVCVSSPFFIFSLCCYYNCVKMTVYICLFLCVGAILQIVG